MKTSLLLSLLVLLPAAVRAAPPIDAQGDPAAWVKSAIDRDWVARAGDFGSVVVSSPIYAMPFGQGCVIHEIAFLSDGGRPSLGQMVAADRYFVFAAGDACASADPTHFFGIEPGNDVFGLLDFARRLKSGPKAGRDRVSDGAFAKMSQCFTPEAMRTTRVMRAHSWRPEGGRRDQYQVTLSCKALENEGDLIAIGARGQDAIAWKVGTLIHTTVDEAVPTERRGD